MDKLFEKTFEIIGWLLIFISPTLIGGLAGFFIYYSNPGTLQLFIAISIGISGLTTGIIWAMKVFRSKKGTLWFLSRTMSTPESEEKEEEN